MSNLDDHIHIDRDNLSDSHVSIPILDPGLSSLGSYRHLNLNPDQQMEYEDNLRRRMSYSGDGHVPIDEGRREIIDVISDLRKKSRKHSRTADLFRACNYITSAIIIIGGAIVGIWLALDEYDNKFVIYGSFAISLIKGLYDLFGLGQRGISYYNAGNQLREKLRKTREALMFLDDGDEMFHYAMHVREEVDEIEFGIYRMSYGPESFNFDGGVAGDGLAIQDREQ